MMVRKKILIMIEWFAPGYKAGGPIQSCVNLCTALKDSYEIFVLTTDTDHGETLPYKDIISNKWIYENTIGVMVFYAAKKTATFRQVSKEIMFIDADFVYLNLFFSPGYVLYPLWLKYKNKIRGKVILCPRGTLFDSATRLKWYKKKPLLKLLKWMGVHKQISFHATNETEAKAITRYFANSDIVVADNLPNTLQAAFRSCIKIKGSLQCILIARIVPIKNLLFLLQLLAEVRQMITLTIVGPVEDEGYWMECKKAINKLPEKIQINYIGPKHNGQLLSLLQGQHLFVLLTKGENFGHSIFESFLAGRPVLISDQTPWLHLAQLNIGWDLPLHANAPFVEALETAASWNQKEFDEFAEASWAYAGNFIKNPSLTNSYHRLFS